MYTRTRLIGYISIFIAGWDAAMMFYYLSQPDYSSALANAIAVVVLAFMGWYHIEKERPIRFLEPVAAVWWIVWGFYGLYDHTAVLMTVIDHVGTIIWGTALILARYKKQT